MRKPILLALLLALFPGTLIAQFRLQGVVLDQQNLEPVPYATVYLNGTTIGTITNIEGKFTIEHAVAPSLLVISHISYETQVHPISSNANNELKIKLKERTLELSSIEITDINLRNINLLHFKNWFLGTDRWGSNAEIKNDSVLVFYRQGEEEFRAVAKAPLLVEMPLLGYDLQVQLEEFIIRKTPDSKTNCSILGYYYFKPYTTTNRLKIIKYEQNRRKAYYNSIQHFCRSLYSGQLEQNGYRLIEKKENIEDKSYSYEVVKIDSCLRYIEGDQALICGFKNRRFIIHYYGDENGKPVDLSKEQGFQTTFSEIYLMNDTCIICSDGIIPDNRRIVFGGFISNKRIGTYLPSDYYPQKKISIGK